MIWPQCQKCSQQNLLVEDENDVGKVLTLKVRKVGSLFGCAIFVADDQKSIDTLARYGDVLLAGARTVVRLRGSSKATQSCPHLKAANKN